MKSHRTKVFISQPFTGKTWENLTKEREGFHTFADSLGLEIVEQFIGYQGKEDFEHKDYNPSFILAKDKNFIKEADVVVADFSSPSVGTDCEVTIAKELFDKKIYAVVPKEKRRHMWLIFYCDYFFDTIEEALEKVKVDFENQHPVSHMDKRQYDPIAVEFRLIEETPAQKYVYDPLTEEFLRKHALGKSVVVLHDGSGYRARLSKKIGAAKVTGIDISYRQSQVARAEELRAPLGIDYLVIDPYSRDFLSSVPPELIGTTDVILGAFLLDHAMSLDELSIISKNMSKLLKPGGVFFGLSDHPNACVPTNPEYGVVIALDSDDATPVDGTLRRISIFQKVPGGTMEVLHFHNFLWTESTVTKVLTEGGFSGIAFQPAPVSSEGLEKLGEEFWESYKQCPTTISFSAKKQ